MLRIRDYNKHFRHIVPFDAKGPALINNVQWKVTEIEELINEINTEELKDRLIRIFPKHCSQYSKSDMLSWSKGSLRIICN